MTTSKPCPRYRKSESLGICWMTGYCDLDCSQTTCRGEIQFCKKNSYVEKKPFYPSLSEKDWIIKIEGRNGLGGMNR